MKKYNRLKNRVDRFKKRTFSITYQYKDGKEVSSNSFNYTVNRKLPDKEWIIEKLKSELNSDAVIILCCFEIQRGQNT